jgi:hypothetical protein
MIFDARTLPSMPESGSWAGVDGQTKRIGSKLHAAVDSMGNLLAPHVSPADMQERDMAAGSPEDVREVTGGT